MENVYGHTADRRVKSLQCFPRRPEQNSPGLAHDPVHNCHYRSQALSPCHWFRVHVHTVVVSDLTHA